MDIKNIAFVELETHASLLEQWFVVLKEIESIRFHFYISAKVKKNIFCIPDQYITVTDNPNAINLLGYDGVVINTLHRNYSCYKNIFETKPVLCLIHNINFSLFFKGFSWYNVFFEADKFLYISKLYLKERIGKTRKIVLQSKYYGVISSTVLDTLKSSEYFSNVRLVSLSYCDTVTFANNAVINIVLPGNISNKRKDIALVFEVLKTIQPVSKLHITFLGKPENTTVEKQLEYIKNNCHSNIHVSYYATYIPQDEYNAVIKNSHLLLCPVKKHSSFYWVSETYGYSKISGAEADCILGGKVGLFPEYYPKKGWHNLYYKNLDDLAHILSQITIPMLANEYQTLQEGLSEFSLQKTTKGIENVLLELVS